MLKLETYGHRYLILGLCLFMFTMWGINLFSLSSIEAFKAEPEKDNVVSSPAKAFERESRINSFLYLLAQELGFRPVSSSVVPAEGQGVAVIIDPSPELTQPEVSIVLDWVESGGRLLLFAPTSNPVLAALGTSVQGRPQKTSSVDSLALRFPWLSNVESLSESEYLLQPPDFRSYVSPISGNLPEKQCYVICRGKGQIYVLSNPDFLFPAGLEKADNIIFVTRLFEGLLQSGRQLSFLIPYSDAKVFFRGELPAKPKADDNRKKEDKKILSLWSVIVANPISWMLVQMALALALYFHAIGKRLGRPIPEKSVEEIQTTLVEGLARLLNDEANYSYLTGRTLEAFFLDARRKFSLPPEASPDDVLARIKNLQPELVPQLQLHLETLFRAAKRERTPLVQILSAMRILEQTRKDLKLYG